MSGSVYLDANSLTYVINAGGTALLDKIASYWQAQGYSLRLSDAVRLDIDANTSASGQALKNWLNARSLTGEQTSFGGTSYIKNNSYGEKANVELARTDIAAGNKVGRRRPPNGRCASR
jgi:hypothetical protein